MDMCLDILISWQGCQEISQFLSEFFGPQYSDILVKNLAEDLALASFLEISVSLVAEILGLVR